MKIEILSTPIKNGEIFKWKLWTGPDGIDEYEGTCDSLYDAMSQIIMIEANNILNYVEECYET